VNIETTAVIFDGAVNAVGSGSHANPHAVGETVSRGIGQGFLNHPIERSGGFGFQLRDRRRVEGDAQVHLPTRAVDQRAKRRDQPEMVENGGPQLVHDAAELDVDQRDEVFDRLKTPLGKRQLTPEVVDGDADGGQQLPDVVVQRVRDPSRLLVQRMLERRSGRGGAKDNPIARSRVGDQPARCGRPRRGSVAERYWIAWWRFSALPVHRSTRRWRVTPPAGRAP
jgi:hypothetical protein